jgi:predicted ATPase
MTMQIQSIGTKNFKSLVDFRLDLAKFSCLIGLNGVGKSTVLQFIDFLAQQARGDVTQWLENRGWRANEVLSRLTPAKTISFTVTVADKQNKQIIWTGTYNPYRLQCTTEKIKSFDAELDVQSGSYWIKHNNNGTEKPADSTAKMIPFTYEGSILSQLRKDVLPTSLLQFKSFLLNIESLDMLTPEHLRQRTRIADGSLGHGGRNLSAFVYELDGDERKGLTEKLKEIYKQFSQIYSKSLRSGWKQLQIREFFHDKQLVTEARHVNDGMLRMVAILAELASGHEFLLFDEIENGINPEIVEFVTDALVGAKQQIMVTTHSPMILNYLEDETAKKGVIYLYKTQQGYTKSIPFFSIPSLKKKLMVMGPGEAFVDTNLTELNEEIAEVTKEEA